MWDIVVPLILMVVFYLVPEILKKRRRPEEYKYPEIPDQVPPPADRMPPPLDAKPAPRRVERPLPPPLPPSGEPAPVDVVLPPLPEHRPPQPHMKPVEPTYAPHLKPVEPSYAPHLPPAAAMPAVAEGTLWDGRLDAASVMNGVVFAEILQPPRARRPLKPWYR